jgi:hypothetical protein
MTTIDADPTAPAAPFNYYMKTTAIMEHSRGIAWTADLFCGVVKVGVIEQAGNGGNDLVMFTEWAYNVIWNNAVAAAFGGDEEAATFCQEDL